MSLEISAWTKRLEALTEKVNNARYPGLAEILQGTKKLVEMLEKKWTDEDKVRLRNMVCLVKLARF